MGAAAERCPPIAFDRCEPVTKIASFQVRTARDLRGLRRTSRLYDAEVKTAPPFARRRDGSRIEAEKGLVVLHAKQSCWTGRRLPLPITHPWLCERSSISRIRLWHSKPPVLGTSATLCRSNINPELRHGPTHRIGTWSWQCLLASCLRLTFPAPIWQLPRRRGGAQSPRHPTDYLGRCNPAHTQYGSVARS